MLVETLKRVEESDPTRGRWDVVGNEVTVRVDASSLAMVATIDVNGDIIEVRITAPT